MLEAIDGEGFHGRPDLRCASRVLKVKSWHCNGHRQSRVCKFLSNLLATKPGAIREYSPTCDSTTIPTPREIKSSPARSRLKKGSPSQKTAVRALKTTHRQPRGATNVAGAKPRAAKLTNSLTALPSTPAHQSGTRVKCIRSSPVSGSLRRCTTFCT
eukprot:scaffold277540_cov36-Tisochrysis_lutea.AAC.3